MAESQAQHRQELEALVIRSNCRSQDRGPIFGFVLAASVIAISFYLIVNGYSIVGLIALISALAAIVVPFITGKSAQKKELQEKREQLASPASEWEYSDDPSS